MEEVNPKMLRTMEIKDAAEAYGGGPSPAKDASEASPMQPGPADAANASKSVSFKNTDEGAFADPKNRTLNALDNLEGNVDGSQTQEQAPEPMDLKKRLLTQENISVEVQQEQEAEGLRKGPLAEDLAAKAQSQEQMDIKVNAKALNGGAHPERHALTINEMIVDPENVDLEELSNPIDYFNIYK